MTAAYAKQHNHPGPDISKIWDWSKRFERASKAVKKHFPERLRSLMDVLLEAIQTRGIPRVITIGFGDDPRGILAIARRSAVHMHGFPLLDTCFMQLVILCQCLAFIRASIFMNGALVPTLALVPKLYREYMLRNESPRMKSVPS